MNIYYNKKWVIKNWRWVILILLAICFFVGTSSFNYFIQKNDFIKWLSPDETANYIFAKLYGQEGEVQFFEKYNLYADDIIHPRSFRSDFGWLKPVSFLGIVLIYGKIISLTSYKLLPYLTPIIGAIGIIFYYLLSKKLFGRRNAFISTLLLASFPAYIYYSCRSMFHNILFIVLLITGLYFSFLMAQKREKGDVWDKIIYKRLIFAALGGSFLGLAVISRTSELLWIAPMLLILWLFNIKKIGLTRLAVFISFFSFCLLPILYHNQILYGSFWQGGYPEMNRSITGIVQASADLTKFTFSGQIKNIGAQFLELKDNIFHFGFYPRKSLARFYYYFVNMFFWIFWPAVIGGILFLQKIKKWKTKHWAYLSAYGTVSLILLFYYGSWGFNDNPDTHSFTIGNSYTRYWLPIYLGAIPFASMFFIKLSSLIKKKFLIIFARILIIILIFSISINFLLFGSEEGIASTVLKQSNSRQEYADVLKLTESDAIIITRYHDKLFFPERKVIVGLFDDKEMVAEYAKLGQLLPVYYYNFTLPEKDVDYLNNKRLKEFDLQIKKIKQITPEFTLYKLIPDKISYAF